MKVALFLLALLVAQSSSFPQNRDTNQDEEVKNVKYNNLPQRETTFRFQPINEEQAIGSFVGELVVDSGHLSVSRKTKKPDRNEP